MSIDATRWAWQQELTASRKLVLLSLADRADESDVAYPSIARLTKDTCLDRKTIMAAITDLEACGFISVIRSQGSGSKYRMLGVPRREMENQYQKRDQHQNTHQSQKRDGTSPKNGTATSTKNGTQNLPIEPINNHKKKTRAKTTPVFAPADMEQIDSDLATEFIAYRKAKRAPLSQTSWKGICREAAKANWTITAVVEEIMTRGWQAFKAEWVLSQGGNHARHEDVDNSAPAKARRAIERARQERGEVFGGDEQGCVLEGKFKRVAF